MSTTAPVQPAIDTNALEQLHADLAAVRPDLARRLAAIIEGTAVPVRTGEYVRLGEASRDLGVSRNTLKKWVRGGLVRDSMQLPGSNEVRVARSEIERLRDYAINRVAMEALGDDDEELLATTSSGTPPWQK